MKVWTAYLAITRRLNAYLFSPPPASLLALFLLCVQGNAIPLLPPWSPGA